MIKMFMYSKMFLIYLMILFLNFQLIFKKFEHPMYLMINFIIYLILINFMIFQNLKFSLYSFMIMISLLGGMMILFNYFISLLNNEKFKFNKIIMLWFLFIWMSFLLINLINFHLNLFNYFNLLNNFNNLNLNMNLKLNLIMVYMYPFYNLMILLILFLIICLLMSIKMSIFKFKPLRSLKF